MPMPDADASARCRIGQLPVSIAQSVLLLSQRATGTSTVRSCAGRLARQLQSEAHSESDSDSESDSESDSIRRRLRFRAPGKIACR